MTFVASEADKIEKLIKLSMLKLSLALGVHRKVPFSIFITTKMFNTLGSKESGHPFVVKKLHSRWTVMYSDFIPGTLDGGRTVRKQ